MADTLAIGCVGLADRDQTVLRALVRVLGNSLGNGLEFSVAPTLCNVLFVPAAGHHTCPRACVVVRVAQPGDAGGAAPDGDLLIVAPLRMSNVLAALQTAAQRLFQAQGASDPHQALDGLLRIICDGLSSHEQRRSVVPIGAAGPLVLDFQQRRLHTALPLADLLAGHYRLGTPQRVTPVEEELARAAPAHDLRAVLWQIVGALAASEVAAGEGGLPPGTRYRLRRWPEATGLAIAGHPRLAALFTNRALTLEQAAAGAELSAARVQRFMQACLALGLAAQEAGRPAAAPAAPARPSPASAAPGWLGMLRERLKLW